MTLPPAAPRKFRVVSIEDNLADFDLIRQLLAEQPEVELISARTGQAGCAFARSRFPDLILLDLNLPDISGVEVLHTLKASAITRRIPVIVISAETNKEQIERLLIRGVDECLAKPFDVDDFFRAIEAVKSRRPH